MPILQELFADKRLAAYQPSPLCDEKGRRSGLLHELGLELHGANAFDPAVDVVAAIAVDEADALDLGAYLYDGRRTFHLQVLDHGDAVAVVQCVAEGVAYGGRTLGRHRLGDFFPLVSALGAREHDAVVIGEGGAATGAWGQGGHGGIVAASSCCVAAAGNDAEFPDILVG